MSAGRAVGAAGVGRCGADRPSAGRWPDQPPHERQRRHPADTHRHRTSAAQAHDLGSRVRAASPIFLSGQATNRCPDIYRGQILNDGVPVTDSELDTVGDKIPTTLRTELGGLRARLGLTPESSPALRTVGTRNAVRRPQDHRRVGYLPCVKRQGNTCWRGRHQRPGRPVLGEDSVNPGAPATAAASPACARSRSWQPGEADCDGPGDDAARCAAGGRRPGRGAEVAGFEPAMGLKPQTRLAGGRHRPD